MTLRDKALAQRIYLLLGILFVTSLVVSNLIFKKFFYFYPIETPRIRNEKTELQSQS